MTENEHPKEIPPVQPAPPSRTKWMALGLMVFTAVSIHLGMPQETEKDKWMAYIFPVAFVLVMACICWILIKALDMFFWLPWPRKALKTIESTLEEEDDEGPSDSAAAKKKDADPEGHEKE